MPNPTREPVDLPKETPWLQLEGESVKAFGAFQVYLGLPPTQRTVVQAFRIVTGRQLAKAPSSWWYEWSRIYRWTERAEAYEEDQAREAKKNDLTDRMKARYQRVQANQALMMLALRGIRKATQAVDDPKPIRDTDVQLVRACATAMKVALENGRAEFGDEPIQRVQEVGVQARVVLAPEDLKKLDANTMVDMYRRLGDGEDISYLVSALEDK